MSFARLVALPLLVVVLAAPPSAAVGPGDFEEAPTSPEATGLLGSFVITADFNGDGDLDLAVAERGSGGSVSILLGNGAGDFSPAPNSPQSAPSPTNGLASEDFNGDDIPDLAVVGGTFMGAALQILLGLGDGDFMEPASSPHFTGFAPQNVVAGHIDGDSTIDLAVTEHKFGEVFIYLGDGAGDFNEPVTSPEAVTPTAYPLALADFNEDGDSDLAVGIQAIGGVTILLGDGAGDFTATPMSPPSAGPELNAIAAPDFNGDDHLDLALPSVTDSNVTILLGDGSGNFALAPSSPEAAGTGTLGIVAMDLSRDGKTDLATANFGSDDSTILLGSETGDFTEAGTSPETTGMAPNSVASGDFDGNNVPDLAVVNENSSDVTILLNTSPSQEAPPSPPGPGPGPGPGEPPPGEAPPAQTCRNQTAAIVGTTGDDTIHGTPGDDIIFSLSGDDSVAGGPGNDLICLSDGDDVGRGGPGNDLVIGNRDDDELLGNKGIDQLFGRRENDTLKGGKGADKCGGGQGNDTKLGCEA